MPDERQSPLELVNDAIALHLRREAVSDRMGGSKDRGEWVGVTRREKEMTEQVEQLTNLVKELVCQYETSATILLPAHNICTVIRKHSIEYSAE